MNFTNNETRLLLCGLNMLADNARKAQELVYDDAAWEALERYIQELGDLNLKLSNSAEKQGSGLKVRDFIRMDVDMDVYDDVCEELAVSFCGPQKLTEYGEKYWADVLGYDIKIVGDHALVCVDDPDEKICMKKLQLAKEFFDGAAGYCSCDEYARWFEEG